MSAIIDPLLRRQREAEELGDDPNDLGEQPDDEHAQDEPAPRRTRTSPLSSRRLRTRAKQGLLVVGALLIPVTYSYANALTGPGSDSLQARTVEWARDHHLGTVVDRVEKYYYAHHQAKVGGLPSEAAQQLLAQNAGIPAPSPAAPGGATDTASTDDAATTATEAAGSTNPGTSDAPATVVPNAPAADLAGAPPVVPTPATPVLPGEGHWAVLGPLVNGKPGAYLTYVRPDDVHTSVLDAVVSFDPHVFSFRAYPGTKIPKPWDRPDYVEAARLPSLVAAFSGGFRLRDSNGGMVLGGNVLQKMRVGGATFAIDTNGVPHIGNWGTEVPADGSYDSVRQNLDLLVDNGQVASALSTDPNRTWGFTGPANKSAVWRTGAGETADGRIVWVGGPGLTILSLAQTLQRAGAVRGMQLDINQEWVQFNTYAADAQGVVQGKKLLSGMAHTGDRWLTEDTRDFVAVFTRTS